MTVSLLRRRESSKNTEMSIDNATAFAPDVASTIITYVLGPVVSVAIVTAAIISGITLWYQKKNHEATKKAEKDKVQLAGLAEAFRLLNDVKHREARKVVYDIKSGWSASESSFNIIGIQNTTSKGES